MRTLARTYHLWTIGCQMNKADSRYLAAELESLGYQPTPKAEDADLVIVNTCVVRQQAEDKACDRLRQLKGTKRRRPDTTIALAGCMVGRNADAPLKERFPFVDVFMPPSDVQPLLDYLAQRDVDAPPGCRPASHVGALPPSQQGKVVTANVPIVLGCSHACTFCVIPLRRGGERSRPSEDIVREVRELVGRGIREVTLLGQIVDRYGLDLGRGADLPALLRDVSEVEGLARIRFLTSHPNWMTDSLIDAVATVPKVCPCIEIPVQAGNDEILARMRRGYTADDYRRLADRLRARVPGVAIHTDIIVGFPGETEAQFMDSYRLMSDVQFEMAHIAKYSERPMTVAAKRFKDDVPGEEKERRRVMLEGLLNELAARKNAALRGQRVQVLAEERGGNGKWHGRTPQNRLAFFPDERDLRGRIVDVVIEETRAFSLFGRARGDGAQP
ncbi:MAG: tRNA (N6-isopentenyl adenosine(37)-C2)-methylthiotransferase MiaB [Verrucomicrobiota bacterium]